jgi:hypothetical protein
MKRWYVVTPEYGTGGSEIEPPEYGCDVVEVDAPTRRAAILAGVRRMLASSRREFRYCRDQRSDGANPFTGVRALPMELDAAGNYGGNG